MRILNHLIAPKRLDQAGIDEAFVASREQLLFGGMSRFDFADIAYHTSNLRVLPVGHLLDHRLRGPLIPPIADRSFSASDQDWLDALSGVSDWLGHMLEPSDRTGARDIVARSLRLDPARDAALLISYGTRSRAFFRHCARGRLRRAARQAEEDFPVAEHGAARALIARLLVYFSCLSIHLVAARAWWVDHFLSDDGDTADPTAFLSSMNYLADMAEAAIGIDDHMARRRKRYPRRNVVSASTATAERWRSNFAEGDDDLREIIAAQLTELSPYQNAVRDALTKARMRGGTANPSVHRALFGVTAGEALAYGATRLVQLRDNSDALVDAARRSDAPPPLSQTRESLPPINSADVAALLYVLRITTLRDATASWEGGSITNEPIEFARPLTSLRQILESYAGNEANPGFETINSARLLYATDAVGKAPKRSSMLTSDGAIDWSLFDVRPDFWLGDKQSAGVQCQTKVPAVPPAPLTLLERKRAIDERNRQHRPPNRWRASGRDRSRREQPRGR